MQDADADKDRGLIAAFRPLAWDRKGTRFMQKRRVDSFWKGKNVLCGSVAGLLYFLWIWCRFNALQNRWEGQTIINYNNVYIYIYIHTHGLFILYTIPNACWLGLSTILKKILVLPVFLLWGKNNLIEMVSDADQTGKGAGPGQWGSSSCINFSLSYSCFLKPECWWQACNFHSCSSWKARVAAGSVSVPRRTRAPPLSRTRPCNSP